MMRVWAVRGWDLAQLEVVPKPQPLKSLIRDEDRNEQVQELEQLPPADLGLAREAIQPPHPMLSPLQCRLHLAGSRLEPSEALLRLLESFLMSSCRVRSEQASSILTPKASPPE